RRGVLVKNRGIVDVALRGVEHGRGRAHRVPEFRLVEGEAVPLAEAPIAFAAKRGTGIDEGEVDVEEDSPGHGPATTIGALAGSRNVRAVSFTASPVTAPRSAGIC